MIPSSSKYTLAVSKTKYQSDDLPEWLKIDHVKSDHASRPATIRKGYCWYCVSMYVTNRRAGITCPTNRT